MVGKRARSRKRARDKVTSRRRVRSATLLPTHHHVGLLVGRRVPRGRSGPPSVTHRQELVLTLLQKLPSKVLFDFPNSGHLEGTAEQHVRLPGPHLACHV